MISYYRQRVINLVSNKHDEIDKEMKKENENEEEKKNGYYHLQ